MLHKATETREQEDVPRQLLMQCREASIAHAFQNCQQCNNVAVIPAVNLCAPLQTFIGKVCSRPNLQLAEGIEGPGWGLMRTDLASCQKVTYPPTAIQSPSPLSIHTCALAGAFLSSLFLLFDLAKPEIFLPHSALGQ